MDGCRYTTATALSATAYLSANGLYDISLDYKELTGQVRNPKSTDL